MPDIPSLNRDFPDIGGDENTWGEILNDIMGTAAAKSNNVTSISTTGGEIVLSEAQELVGTIVVSGTLTVDSLLQFSGRSGVWLVTNGTTGDFSLTLRIGAAGDEAVIMQGDTRVVANNGTEWVASTRDCINVGSGSVSSGASMPISLVEAIAAGYRRFLISVAGIVPQTNGTILGVYVYNDGGTTPLGGITQTLQEAWYAVDGYFIGNESLLGDEIVVLATSINSGAPSCVFMDLRVGSTNTFWTFTGPVYYDVSIGFGSQQGTGQVFGGVNALSFGLSSREYHRRIQGDWAQMTAEKPPFPDLRRIKINRERDRRFGLGAPVDLGGGLTFVAQVTPEARSNIGDLALAATRAIMANSPFSIDFRDLGNVTHTLNAVQTIAMAEQAIAYVSAIYAASWALKDSQQQPPPDISDDANWP